MTGRLLNSRYQLLEQIGTGGMAEVYRATDNLLGRTVAVKMLHPQYAKDPVFIERFRQEAQAAANLNQPNIVNVFDWGIEDSTYYIVMEYVEGMDLKDIILSGGPLLPERAVEIGMAICLALESAHSHGIVHRDIKPQNIIVTRDNRVKVMDFGIARAAGGSAMTQTGTIMGTAQYISPEQAQGRTADPRSDLYSLGIVIYEMLTAKVPFGGENPVAIAYKHVREDPLPPSMLNPDISPELESVVMKALSKNPENRYQNALEMRADLERCLEGAPVYATPVLRHDETSAGATQALPAYARGSAEPRRSRAWLWIIVVMIVLAGAGVGAWALVKSTSGVSVPDLVGQTETAARQMLTDAGLALGNTGRAASNSLAKGQVVSQNPGAGSKVSKSMKVDIVVSSGPTLITVPDVRGLSQSSAKAKITGAGLVVGNVSEEFSAGVPVGRVSSQEPAPDERVSEKTEVNLAVSKGPEMVTVPNVVGMQQDAATQQLQASGLGVQVQQVPDATQPEGAVTAQDPAAGQSVPKGGKITISVVVRPQQVKVPSVVGQTQSAAQATLANAGFQVTLVRQQTSTPSKVGKVISQSPGANVLADKGSSVAITVGAALPAP